MTDEVIIRPLFEADVVQYREMRLEALRLEPTAFASDYESTLSQPLDFFKLRLTQNQHRFVLGAFVGEVLLGNIGFHREERSKMAHRGTIWGVYVRQLIGVGGLLESC
ncbi:MAG: hypothetical protein R2865_02100 [Deinococcales bacterium]